MDDVPESLYSASNRSENQRSQHQALKSDNADLNIPASQQPSRQQKGKGVYENFTKTIFEYNKKRNTPIGEQPQIDGRPVNLYALYGYVLKAGGSEMVEHRKLWSTISNALSFAGNDDAIADIHKRCLREYEKEWLAKRKASQQTLGVPDRPVSRNAITMLIPSETPHLEQPVKSVPSEQATVKTPYKTESRNPATSDTSVLVYKPLKRKFDTFAGLEPTSVTLAAKDVLKLRPYPTFQELGRLDIQALSRSIQSTLPAEIGHALDILVIIAGDRRWGLPLVHCGNLLDSLVDCMSDGVDHLGRSAAPWEFTTYQDTLADLRKSSKRLNLATVVVGSEEFQRHAVLHRIMSVLTILRNLAFTEINQEAIAGASGLVKALAAAIVSICAIQKAYLIPMAIALDFRKDLVTLLSLIGHHLVVEDAETAGILIQFFLTFSPYRNGEGLGVTSYNPASDPYVAPAIDGLAKLISRDIPNRQLCARTLLLQNANETSPLTSMMSLAIAILPDTLEPDFLRVLPKRIPLLHHALIIAEAAANLCPSTSELAKNWMEEHTVFSWRLINLLRTLAATSGQHASNLEQDTSTFITRINAILKMLNEKARTSGTSQSLTRAEKAIIFFESGVDV